MRSTILASCCLIASSTGLWAAPAHAGPPVPIFETGQVRPLALSADGKWLYAVNTPDARLEIFRTKHGGLEHAGSVQVGLEPVAVAARGNDEVWVVNNLSDSVSVVSVRPKLFGGVAARVVRTLLVGDEPRDIVFAGPGRRRAFITAAHRGQNVPFDPQSFTEGVGRADVWVFDANDLGESLEGSPLTILTLFADTPRALAVTPDGRSVYAAGFLSGNRTSVVTEVLIPPELRLPPTTNYAGVPQPPNGIIVKYDGTSWLDELGRPWDFMMMFTLPDRDVFSIDAMANPPVAVAGETGTFSGVGTVLYNMAVNPVSGRVYVSNTDADNQRRFEGPGIFAGSTVRGRHNLNRITVLDPGSASPVQPRHLNKHIDFDACCAPIPNAENETSVAIPTGLTVSGDGRTLYVAALGTDEVAVYDTAALEADTFVPDTADQIPVSGGGPTGLVLDEKRDRLYVMTRFDNAIAIVDTNARAEVGKASMYNPEPANVTAGRRFLYDATVSSHGDSACATCHVFGDLDALAWDLGNPDDDPALNANPIGPSFFFDPVDPSFQPMKGPMTTQSLRGMANHGPMHWRGDRTGGLDEASAQPDSGAFDERAAFLEFQLGFINLLGRPEPLPDPDMQAFADFILQVMYPPNPHRALDNSLTPDQQAGRDMFFNRKLEIGGFACNDCHRLDPAANSEFGVDFPGFFGGNNVSTREPFPQVFKIPHLRNLYQKVGMFGMVPTPIISPIPGLDGFLGEQIRGFGTSRAGDTDNIVRFLSVPAFNAAFPFPIPNPEGFQPGPEGLAQRFQVASFLLVFDSNLAPVVGQQVTWTAELASEVAPRIALLKARSGAGECDLIAKTYLLGRERGFLYAGGDIWLTDTGFAPTIHEPDLERACLAAHVAITLTCVPPGSGVRFGIDRDLDGVRDGNE
jgi:DNA-binding beta-propeller fold protein YncE